MAKFKQCMKGPNEVVPFDHHFISYPQLASVKMDGFRLINLCGEHLLSPALKPFPNRNMAIHLTSFLAHSHYRRWVTDGEFWSPDLSFQELQSIVRSHDKPIPESVKYYVFDMMSENEWDMGIEETFSGRWLEVQQLLQGFPNIVPVTQVRITSSLAASDMFDSVITAGQEGIILRSPSARYKHGRCTLKQDGMWKFKEFQTHDAVIVGVEEQMKLREGVERTTNEIGHLERRYEQSLYEPAGMVGAFIVDWKGQQFKVKPGKGYDHDVKRTLWIEHATTNCIIGKHIEFKYMPHGTMDKPRIGSLVRFRPDLD